MKILNRYLLKEVITSFLIALGLIVLLFLLNDIFYLTDVFINKRVPLAVVLKVLFLSLPSILTLAIPLAFMAGLLGGLAHLNADGEIEALKLMGVSPGQLFKPVMRLALILSLVTLLFTFWLAPRANYEWLQTMIHSVFNRVNLQVEAGQFAESFPGHVIYVHQKDEAGNWQGIFLYKKEEQDNMLVMLAESGQMRPGADLKTAGLTLVNGSSYRFNLNQPETIAYNEFKKQEQLIDLKKLFPLISPEKRYREKSLKELLTDWKKLGTEKNRQESLALKVEFNRRCSLPAACLFFAFLGLGLGWRKWPGGRAGGYGVSLVVLAVYYVILVFGQTRAQAGKIAPFLGLWLPNALVLLAGLYAFFSASRESRAGIFPGSYRLRALYQKAAKSVAASPRQPSSRRSGWHISTLTFLDRYILSKFVPLLIYIFLALLFVMAAFNFLSRWEIVRESHQPAHLLFSFIWYKLPEFAIQAIQLAALIASVLCLSFLYRRNEIQTLITSGLSYWRLTAPLLMVALVLIPPAFFLQDRLAVRGNFEAEKIWNELTDRPGRAFSYLSRYWLRNDHLPGFFHYELSSPEENTVRSLFIFQTGDEPCRLKRIIFSPLAKIGEDSLSLEPGWERLAGSENLPFSRFDSFELSLPDARKQFIKEWKEPALMTLTELSQYSDDLERSGSQARNFRVEAHLRIAFPFSVFVLTLMGIAIAGLSQKKLFVFPLGLALGGSYLFWQTVAVFRSLGQAGVIIPCLAAWSPQIIFLLIGFYLLFKVRT
ncbi:MAG: LptF/LptG family permease [Acidobacteriota bacterium]|nr:LptF/LptG family permease [Acidobacteriota bacterium]